MTFRATVLPVFTLLLAIPRTGLPQDAATAEKLLPLLKDPDPTVRIATVQQLGTTGLKDYAAPLLPLLADADGRVRWAVADAFRNLQAKYLEGEVGKLLKNDRGGIRDAAAFCLGVIDSRAFILDLQRLLRDPDPRVRASSAFALARLEVKSAAKDVSQLLADEDARVRWAALMTLRALRDASFGRDVAPLLADPDPLLRWSAVQALRTFGAERWISGDLEKLLSDRDAGIRRDAALAVELFDVRAFTSPVAGLLQDPDAGVRWAAVRVLHKVAATSFLSDVQKLLDDPDRDVRRAAAAAIPVLEGKKSAEGPPSLPQADAVSRLDPTTVFTFGGYARKVVDAAESLEKGAHWSLALSLGRIPGRAGVDDLESLMSHPLPELRRSVVWILEEWESPDAIKALRRAGDGEKDPGVKAALRDALKRAEAR